MKPNAQLIAEIREILKHWGTYDRHYDSNGQWCGSWFSPLNIDRLSDREVLEIAGKIAAPKRK
jgi:hypothetical protein